VGRILLFHEISESRVMSWIFKVLLILSLSQGSSEAETLVRKLQSIANAYSNTTISGFTALDGNKSSKFEYKIGRSRDDYDYVVERIDILQSKKSRQISESYSRDGIWVYNGDFSNEETLPPYYNGGVSFDGNELILSGVGHIFGLWGLGLDGYLDLKSPEAWRTAELKTDKLGKHLALSNQYLLLRFYFNGPEGQLSEVWFDFDGFVKHHTGQYGSDGMPVFELVPEKKNCYWSDIIVEEDQIREMQLNYWDGTNWKKTRKTVIEKVEPLTEPFSERIEFVATRRPEGDRVAIDRHWGKFAMRDGQVVQLFDRAAHEVLSDLAGRELPLPKGRKIPYHLEDYLRRITSNHCGVYASAAVLTAMGIAVDLDNMFDHKFISSTGGSSAADLVSFIESHGAHAKVYSGASVELLKSIVEQGDMAILHFKQSHQADGRQHWAAFLGMTVEGESKVVDLPRALESLSTAELLTDWDGIAIVVSRQPVVGYAAASFFSSIGFWVVALVVVLGLLHLLSSRLRHYKKIGTTNALLGVILVGGLIMDHANPNGLSRNPQAVGVVVGRYMRDSFPKIQDLPLTDGEVLVDARLPEDYGRIKIPGSVNLPVDFSIGELRAFTAVHTNLEQPLIVYCTSSKCGWADHLSSRLSALGYRNIKVYEPGVAGYFNKERS
jgi:rhodanese-related sulfurtransferase